MLRKKSLGQHFLTSPHYLTLIADSADIKAGERVLEVGPGEGALTAELLARDAQVTVIEKDSRLIPLLKEKFVKEIAQKKLEVIEGDVLGYDISYLFENTKYKVVANIPYYITGALLKKFLSEKNPASPKTSSRGGQPSLLVLLLQKEVAERIARSKKESILSLSIKAYGVPAYIKTVPRGAFSPPPTVDSAILKIADVSQKHFDNSEEEKRFFELVRAGFAQKRKLLARNLEKVLGAQSSNILQNVGISKNARAEDVALAQWLVLTKNG